MTSKKQLDIVRMLSFDYHTVSVMCIQSYVCMCLKTGYHITTIKVYSYYVLYKVAMYYTYAYTYMMMM